MPFTETVVATYFLAGFLALPIAIMSNQLTGKPAIDRVASSLPTATVAAYQLILSSYPLNNSCSVGQRVLLCITLSVLTLVTGGMALVQHKSETNPNSTWKDHIFKGGSTVLYPWLRAFFSSVTFFFVSFLTPPAPQCLIPWTPIPSGAAWIVAVLLGSIMTLGALVGPPDAKALRKKKEARDAEAGSLTQPLHTQTGTHQAAGEAAGTGPASSMALEPKEQALEFTS